MACDVCKDTRYSSVVLNNNDNGCSGCEPETCSITIDASCVQYTGSTLSCISVNSDLCLETVIQKLDEKLCSLGGGPNDYLTYDLACLRNVYEISTTQQFVEAITDYTCKINESLIASLAGIEEKFSQTNIAIEALKHPEIESCTQVGISRDDDLVVVLNKLKNASCELFSQVNPSAANWNSCFTIIGNPPATITQGFNKILDYVCSIQSQGGNLPVFNNTGTCLNGTNSDGLQDTILNIRNRLCQTPTFNAGNLSSQNCITVKSGDSLESVVSAVLSQVSALSTTSIRGVDPNQFTLQDLDPANPCLGKKISISNSFMDKKVGATPNDQAPGTLSEKLVAGSNVILDIATTPGKMIISSSGGAQQDERVKVSATDPAAGYLIDKLTGSSGDIQISTSLVNNKVQVSAAFDYNELVTRIIDSIEGDDDLKKIFCDLVRSCPSPCSPPGNVQIVLA